MFLSVLQRQQRRAQERRTRKVWMVTRERAESDHGVMLPRDFSRGQMQSDRRVGADIPGGIAAIAAAALATGLEPDEVWCAAGSGVLARGLALAWPKARRHVVQIGRELAPKDVAGARIHVYPRAFGQVAIIGAPFPADPHYDAKAWELCVAMSGPGRILFWNVAPLPRG